jgi:hypothetical protein
VCGLVLAQSEWDFGIGQKDQVAKGLISYWAMRNSGTTVYDEWSTNNGTAVNSPTFGYASGLVSAGASFKGYTSGGTNYVTFPANGACSFAGLTAASISLWVKPATTNIQATLFVASTTTLGWTRLGVYYQTTRYPLLVWRDSLAEPTGSAGSCASDILIATNQWSHIVAVYDSVTDIQQIYVNGSLGKQTTVATVAFANTLSASVSSGVLLTPSEVNLVNGDIDEIRLYNRALTLDEVRQLYRMGAIPRGTK